MLIVGFLQLQPGVFLFLCHYAAGKYSKSRASFLTLFFILGVETSSACLFLCSYLFANMFFLYTFHPNTSIFAWLSAGILIALALVSLFCYFRPGRGTQLFIPRRFATSLERCAHRVSSRSDAFVLGICSGLCELIFTLPLYVIASVEIMLLGIDYPASYLLALPFVLVPIIPLFFIRWSFKSGRNLADIQRARVHNKPFVRTILFLSYLAIAALIILFRITTP